MQIVSVALSCNFSQKRGGEKCLQNNDTSKATIPNFGFKIYYH